VAAFAIVLTVLLFLVATLLVGVILLQESKGGGLAALGGTSAESAIGARTPLRKVTVYLLVIFISVIIILGMVLKRTVGVSSFKPKTGTGTGTGSNPGDQRPILPPENEGDF